MNVLLCVKQVPDTARTGYCGRTETLPAGSASSALNPMDKYAVEIAARLKDADPEVKVTALTLGSKLAEQALRDCLALTADSAYLLCDPLFEDSDSLATSYTLSVAIKALAHKEGPFDLILCGRQAADSDEGHVGPQLAEWLGLPQVTCGLAVEREGASFKVHRETQAGTQVVTVPTPCVVTVTKSALECRYPDILRMMESNRAEIFTLRASDLSDLDLTQVGRKGASTHIKKIVPPPQKTGRIRIEEESDENSARKLYQLLNAAAIL